MIQTHRACARLSPVHVALTWQSFAGASTHDKHGPFTRLRTERLRSRRWLQHAAPTRGLENVGFAFDLDGVLYQGQRAVPWAREMLLWLREACGRYIFLTNGGGTHESVKAKSLADKLCMSESELKKVLEGRVIVSHTPMAGWSNDVKQQTVLITGTDPDKAREVATKYGFKRAITPADLIHANDTIYPFPQFKDSQHAKHRPLPDNKSASRITDAHAPTDSIPADALRFDKILIWNDPRDWSLDIQVIHDLLVSHRGYLGTVSARNGDATLPNRGWQQDGQPEVWVSNLDLYWKTEFPVNRLGTGAFVEALRGVWCAVTDGAELQYRALGKPQRETYSYAHERLLQLDGKNGRDGESERPLRTVYMIGDNPESDIRGAGKFEAPGGTEWVPVLVRTGVWRQTAAEQQPRYRPAVIVDDVVDAVVWALQREGIRVSRESVMARK